MRTIIKSLIVVSALVAGGSAFAGDVGDTATDQVAVSSLLQFSAQATNRGNVMAPAMQRQAAVPMVKADPRQTIIDMLGAARGTNN